MHFAQKKQPKVLNRDRIKEYKIFNCSNNRLTKGAVVLIREKEADKQIKRQKKKNDYNMIVST